MKYIRSQLTGTVEADAAVPLFNSLQTAGTPDLNEKLAMAERPNGGDHIHVFLSFFVKNPNKNLR